MLTEVKSPLGKLKQQAESAYRERWETDCPHYPHLKNSKLEKRSGSMAAPMELASLPTGSFGGVREGLIVFLNGRFAPSLSSPPEGVVVAPLERALATYGTFLQGRWKQWVREETDAQAMLNGARHEEGVLVYIPPRRVIDQPLRLVHLIEAGDANDWVYPRLHLFVGASSEVVIGCETEVINGQGCMINQVWDLHLEQNASVRWEQSTVNLPQDCWCFGAMRAHLKRDSRLTTVSHTNGAECVREDVHVVLAEAGADVKLNAVWQLDDKREAHYKVMMHHQAPHCTSSQLFKGALSDFTRSSFTGKIYVDAEAQKTDAFQLNSNLLLSERAHAACEPCLEIFADDVKASHGATVGRLNADQLMYLQTRGLEPEQARKILVEAYLAEVNAQFQVLAGGR